MDFQDGRGSDGGLPEANLGGENALAAAAAAAQGRGIVLLPNADNVVVLPAGATLDDLSVQGRDIIVTLPDGRVFVVPDGAVYVPQIVVGDVAVPPLNLAALLTGNEPQPAAGPVQSSGGNFADPTDPIQAAYGLGDLLPYTELSFSVEQQEEVLPDLVDDDPDVIIETPDNPAGAINAIATVDEEGLPARGDEPAGTAAETDVETTTGTIVFNSPDGTSAVLINGEEITTVGQSFTSPFGTMTITSIDLAGGRIGFNYTLADNLVGVTADGFFTMTVIDADGDAASATLQITVVDDGPVGIADSGTVAAGTFGPIEGNVIANDVPGADGFSGGGATAVTGFASATETAAPGGTVSGTYGELTLNADGTYSYTRSPGTPGGVEDHFTYSIVDGDGTAATNIQLMISIGDSGPAIVSVPEIGEGTEVNENQLPPTTDTRSQEAPGSQFVSGPETTTGTITFHSDDGVSSVSLGGTVITPGSLPQVVASDATGTLTVVGYAYDPATGDGSVTYVYTLTDNTANTDGSTVSFPITVIDADGDTASDTLDIHIIDDVPDAINDTAASVAEDASGTIGGNVLANDTQGADGASVTSVTIGGTAHAIAASGTTSVSTANGVYTFDAAGNWTFDPATGLDQTGGDVDASFTYTLTDGDGDTDTALQPISITDGAAPSAGEPISLSVDDEHLASGSNPAAPVTDTGDIVFTPGSDAIDAIAFGTDLTGLDSSLTWVRVDDTTITGSDGATLIVTLELTRTGDTATVAATLSDNFDAHPAIDADDLKALGSVDVVATDIDGDTATSSVSVSISDDVPTAGDDSASQTTENTAFTISVFGNDTFGADGVDTANAAKVFVSSQASQGAVTYDAATGLFTYTPNPGAGSTSTADSFEYTIVDGDGDTATATVDITLQPDSETQGGETVARVDDDGLAGGNPASTIGDIDANTDDDPADTGEASFTGTLGFDVGNDTPATITFDAGLDGSTATIGLETVTYSISGSMLTARITGGARHDTPLFQVEILDSQTGDYRVTLLTNVLNSGGPNNEAQNAFASIDFTVTDSDGDTASTNLGIVFNDDAPTAYANANSVTEGAAVSGNVLSDATDDVLGADGAAAGGAVTGVATGSDTSNPVSGNLGGAGIAGTYGTLILNANGTYSYDANPDVIPSGTAVDHFVYTITDGDGDTSTTTLDITINNVTVTASDTDALVDEKGLAAGGSGENADGIPGNGSDQSEVFTAGAITPSGGTGPYSYALTGSATGSYGALVLNTDGTYTYTLTSRYDTSPDADNSTNTELGRDSFSYTVTDANGNTATGTIVVDIVDDVPTAEADVNSLTENTASVGGNVLANDVFGADGIHPSERIVSVSGSTAGVVGGNTVGDYGTLQLNLDGTYTYLLNTAAVQGLDDTEQVTDTFSYTIKDGDGDTSTAQLTVTITGANDAPVANDDTNWVLDVTSGPNPTTTGNVLQNLDHAGAPSGTFGDVADSDVDVETLTVTGVTGGTVGSSLPGSHGSIVINSNGSYTYTLNASSSAVNALAAGETLTDSFTYTVSDGTATDMATVTITIFGTNDAPVVTGSAVPVSEEGLLGGIPDDDPTSPADADTTNSVTATGSITITDADASDTHTVTLGMPTQTLYTPDGVTALTWVLTDSHTLKGYSTNINNPEILVTIDDSGDYTVTLGGPVLHADMTTEDLTSFVIPVTVNDGAAITILSNAITVTIEDDSPVAAADSSDTLEGSGTSGNVLLDSQVGADRTAAWPDGMITGIASLNQGTSDTTHVSGQFVLAGEFGTLTMNRDGTYTYQSNANSTAASDQDVFEFTMVDADGDSSTATLTINVHDVTLVADNQIKQVDEAALDTTTTGSDLGHGAITGSNPGSTAETVTGTLAVTGPTGAVTYVAQSVTTAYGIFQLNSNGTYTYTLTNPYTTTPSVNNGAAVEPAVETFTYTAHDLYGNSVTGTVKIDVKDDVPTAITPKTTSMNNAIGASGGNYLDDNNDVDDDYGADGGKVIFTTATITSLQNQNLTSGFASLNYAISVDGTVLTATKSTNGSTVFTVSLQPGGSSDQYVVDIAQKLDSTSTIDFNAGNYNFEGGNSSWAGFVVKPEDIDSNKPITIDNNSLDLLLTPEVNGAPASTLKTTANIGGVGEGASVGSTETFRVDFVTDLRGDPSDGKGEYEEPTNRDHVFDGHYTVNGVSALFKSTTNSTVTISAYDDADGNNVVGDGVQDTINGVVITWHGGVNSGLITTSGNYTVNGHNFSVTFANGSVTVAGVEGANGSDMTGTVIAVYTATGYNSVEYSHTGGETFQIGDFGATVLTTNPINFTVPVTVVDNDGDTASGGNLAITLNAVPPIALDLDGDGVEYLSLADGVTHDYGAGLVQTAWVASDDGLLAHDTGNGLDIVFTDDAAGATTDLEGLRLAYDSNGDGKLTAADADFGDFGVWQDANSNGIVDEGEYQSLLKMGITSIDLTASGPGSLEAGGDVVVHGTAQYTMKGTTYSLADVSFATAEADSRIAARTTEIAAVSLAAAGFVASEAAHAEPLPAAAAEVVAAALQTFEAPQPEIQVSLPETSEATPTVTPLEDQAPHDQEILSSSHPDADASDEGAQHGLGEVAQQDFAPETSAASDEGPVQAGAPEFSFGGLDGSLMQALLLAAQSKQAGASEQGANADLPAIKEAIAESAGQQAVDALIDHFAGNDASHVAPDMTGAAGLDHALGAMLAGAGVDGLHTGMAAGFEMAAIAAAVEAHAAVA